MVAPASLSRRDGSLSRLDAVPSRRDAVLPRRDDAARARLAAVGSRGAPLVLARDRALAVPGPLGAELPRVQRGTVVVVGGPPGSGATTVALGLAAAATSTGEWAAAVDAGSLGALAAAEAGVDLARLAVVRSVPPDRWATVVAALLDGASVVLATVPRRLRTGDARRLVARARERAAVLVPLGEDPSAWPVEATLRIHARGGRWTGLGRGAGELTTRVPAVAVTGRGRQPTADPVRLGRVG